RTACGTQAAEVAFWREYGDCRFSGEHFRQAAGLPSVAIDRAQAIGVHVINIAWFDGGLSQRGANGARHAGAALAPTDGRTEAEDVAMDWGFATPCVFEIFQSEHARPFADDPTIAIAIERAARLCRRVVAAG